MMSLSLKLTVIIFAIILFFVVFRLLNKKTIPIKYALVWFFSVFIILLIIAIPNLMEQLAKLMGFELLSNMVLCLFIAILMFLTITLTVMVAKQKEKTTLLIQELSLLKKELGDKK